MASLTYLLCSLLSIFNLESCYLEYKPAIEKERKALFVFGDSLFDAGNNAYLNSSTKEESLYWPYGETFFKHPTGRFSDGRLVPDLIATLAGLPMLPPYLEPIPHVFTDGSNFASAGACVLNHSAGYINLSGQIAFLKNVVGLLKKDLGDAQAMKVLTNAVYFFSIGGNDYNVFYSKNPNATEASRTAFVKLVTANLYKSLLEVTSLGARKIAFQTVGPVGCRPSDRLLDGECVEGVNALAVEHNKALPEVLKKLESEIPGFRYSIFDYYNAIMDRLWNPRKYGFKEGQIACCGAGPFRGTNCGGYGIFPFQLCKNPFEYLWFDGSHTTEGANDQLSQLIWEGPTNVTGPYTVQQLFQI